MKTPTERDIRYIARKIWGVDEEDGRHTVRRVLTDYHALLKRRQVRDDNARARIAEKCNHY